MLKEMFCITRFIYDSGSEVWLLSLQSMSVRVMYVPERKGWPMQITHCRFLKNHHDLSVKLRLMLLGK